MRILYYINQFFGQIGGEEMADHPLEIRNELVGPAIAMSAKLAEGNEIVATAICGDNYAVGNEEHLTEELTKVIKDLAIDLVVAGPAFNAGRYGMACGIVCKIAFYLDVPAVSGMYEENPGLEIYRKYGFIFPTGNNAGGMRKAMPLLVGFVNKLASGADVYDFNKEGYFKRGIRRYFFTDKTGAERAVDMMLDKVNGRNYVTELEMPNFTRVPIAPEIKDLKQARIAIVTTCGPVPVGNPDRIEAHTASKWCTYRMEDFGGIEMNQTEIAHGGYSPINATNNGNRVIPVDAMVALEEEGYIGEFYKEIYSTVGNSMPVDRAEEFGKSIAQSMLDAEISGAIMTSA